MRYTPTGRPVTSFSIVATLADPQVDSVRRSEPDWFNVVVWGALAETCKETLSANQPVYVEGKLKTRHWQDADQTLHSRAEIVALCVFPLALPS
jgi:single-strand DNA-binding protein